MKQLIFSTNTSSQHVREYRDNPAAAVYFYDPQLFQGLLLRGKMRIADDQLMRNRIWRDGDEVYYKLGPTDPDCCAMLFTAHGGRWYENLEKHDLKIQ